MRLLFTLLVLAAAGYLGYNYYQDHYAGKSAEEMADGPAETQPAAPNAPAFESKIPMPPAVPGEKRLAPPGVFYMIDRVSITHDAGIAAAIPGEQVKLMQRKGNGMLRVTTGKFDFEVKESQVTNDLDLAQAAERQYALTHPVKR